MPEGKKKRLGSTLPISDAAFTSTSTGYSTSKFTRHCESGDTIASKRASATPLVSSLSTRRRKYTQEGTNGSCLRFLRRRDASRARPAPRRPPRCFRALRLARPDHHRHGCQGGHRHRQGSRCAGPLFSGHQGASVSSRATRRASFSTPPHTTRTSVIDACASLSSLYAHSRLSLSSE